jgi:hypothetical protein
MSNSTLSKSDQPSRELSVEIAEENVRRLHREVQSAIEAANTAIATIHELAGPNPGRLPSELKTLMNMGAGYFRTVNATIERLFRELNARRRAQDEERE